MSTTHSSGSKPHAKNKSDQKCAETSWQHQCTENHEWSMNNNCIETPQGASSCTRTQLSQPQRQQEASKRCSIEAQRTKAVKELMSSHKNCICTLSISNSLGIIPHSSDHEHH
eukprot:4915778-Amphidinium_carterae.1